MMVHVHDRWKDFIAVEIFRVSAFAAAKYETLRCAHLCEVRSMRQWNTTTQKIRKLYSPDTDLKILGQIFS